MRTKSADLEAFQTNQQRIVAQSVHACCLGRLLRPPRGVYLTPIERTAGFQSAITCGPTAGGTPQALGSPNP